MNPNDEALPDEALVQRILHDEEPLAAFSVLYLRHRSMVRSTAFRIVQNKEDADDIAQDVFWKALQKEKLSELKNPSRLQQWLRRITANKSIDRKRRRRHPTTDLESCDDIEDETFSPERSALTKEAVQEETEELLRYLKEKAKPITVYKVGKLLLQGCSIEETAKKLKLRKSAVQVYRSTAKREVQVYYSTIKSAAHQASLSND